MHKVGIWKETKQQFRVDFISEGKKTMSMIFPKPVTKKEIGLHMTNQLRRPIKLEGSGKTGDVYMNQTGG